MADRQFGVIHYRQLRSCGLGKATISRLVDRGWLRRKYPRVYVVGHLALRIEGELATALLYAGPGAALSHLTGSWWKGLLSGRPRAIQISAPRRVPSLGAGVRCFHRPALEREMHNGLPVVPIPQLLLEISTMVSFNSLRWALSQATHQRKLDLAEIEARLGRGHAGSATVREALAHHLPQLARTRSELERSFLYLCEDFGLPIPEVNVKEAGWEVDALWAEQCVAVELDGKGAHGTEVDVARDRRKELDLRAAGLHVVRYSYDQVNKQAAAVAEDAKSVLAGRSNAI